MTSDYPNPLGMVPDKYAGDRFVLSETECTEERKQFFNRFNEIIGFLYVTKHSLDECQKKYKTLIPKLPDKENSPIRLEIPCGKSIIILAKGIENYTIKGINILTRQIFIMFYGSFETYLYHLFERTYPQIGIKENTLDISIGILMKKKWDGKFNKMNNIFNIGYKTSDLIKHFSKYEMTFEGNKYNNPLLFLDKLAQIRHRIIHASSILENDQMIFIEMKIFHEFYGFYHLLTEYVDNLFCKKYGYEKIKINPAKA